MRELALPNLRGHQVVNHGFWVEMVWRLTRIHEPYKEDDGSDLEETEVVVTDSSVPGSMR